MSLTIRFRIKEIKQEASRSVLIVLDPVNNEKLNYKAGQFLTFLFEIDGRKIRRSYSLCTSPLTDMYPAVIVKRVSNGEVSRFIQDSLREGDIMEALQPAGRFVLEDSDERDIFLLGAGSGISPLLGMLKYGLHNEAFSKFHLLYSNRNIDTTIFFSEIENLKAQFTERFTVDYFFSESQNLYMARLHRTLLEEIVQKHSSFPLGKAVFYICGPYEFMQMAEIVLIGLGASKDNIRKENFVIESQGIKAFEMKDKTSRSVKLLFQNKYYNLVIPYNKSILDVALEQNVNLPYNCRAGKCSACMGKCIEGQVVMSYNEVLTEKDEKNGFVLTCTAHPLTDNVHIQM